MGKIKYVFLLYVTTFVLKYDVLESRCLWKGHNTRFETKMFPNLIQIDMNHNKITPTENV